MRLLQFSLLALSTFLVAPSIAQTTSAALPEPVEVVKLEQNLWTTMAEGNFASVRALFAPDFIQVDDRIRALDSLLITLKHCKIESYELRDLQVRILTANSAMTAYHVVNKLNCGTAEKPRVKNGDENAMTIWVRQPNGKGWLVQAHAEAPASADTIAEK